MDHSLGRRNALPANGPVDCYCNCPSPQLDGQNFQLGRQQNVVARGAQSPSGVKVGCATTRIHPSALLSATCSVLLQPTGRYYRRNLAITRHPSGPPGDDLTNSRHITFDVPHFKAASRYDACIREGRGSWKRGCIKGGWVNFVLQISSKVKKGGRGRKI